MPASDGLRTFRLHPNLSIDIEQRGFVEAIGMAVWCACAMAIAYTSRYFLPDWWAMVRRRERPEGYKRKADIGALVFMGIGLCGIGILIVLNRLAGP